jgi:undecaprenyl-diphosphatase
MAVSLKPEGVNPLIQRFDQAEAGLCSMFNRISNTAFLLTLFRTVSRLGDGVVWYVLMIALPLMAGVQGFLVSVQMAGTALVGLFVYKLLKIRLVRERPFIGHGDISCNMPPLDQYSFPSGHTLHAVGFSIILYGYYPGMAFLLVPFALLVALSRLVLGLHYPTDVVAGALIGYALGAWSFDVAALFSMSPSS